MIHEKKVNQLKNLLVTSQIEKLPSIKKGTEYHILSVGQYNLIDVVKHVVNDIGECSVDLAVWTAANASIKKADDFVKYANVQKMRWIIDPSFRARQPGYVQTLEALFSKDCIRTLPTHAKFIILYNERFSVTIQTSMNLNQNKRLESFTIVENEALCSFYRSFVDLVFCNLEEQSNFGSQKTNVLKTLLEKEKQEINPDIELGEFNELEF